MKQEDIDIELGWGIGKNENCEDTVRWRKIITNWDNGEGEWTGKTVPRTRERRALIIKILDIPDTRLCLSLMNDIPLNEPAVEYAVSSKEEYTDCWVTPGRIPDNGCWSCYFDLLRKKSWNSKAIETLNRSTTCILNHLTDPKSSIKKPIKGLVIGYVQSGKTANFTALIAKAIDVGYRFIVVLSGRTDILRDQTQARLDMELLGWESLSEQEKEIYKNKLGKHNPNYESKFVTYKHLDEPIKFNRLTGYKKDFDAGSIASLPLTNTPYIAVLKKNPKRLAEFANSLGKSTWRKEPILVIDDEADEASVNTSSKNSTDDITKIAKLIANILSSSEYVQYIGYTATPYANVFIRPDKMLEVFPSDFVISLSRPEQYMGALEIFDIDEGKKSNSYYSCNENAHIRIIEQNDLEKYINDPFCEMPRLGEAIDAFILAGAIKLWRKQHSNDAMKFTHHTMLINTDRLTKMHEEVARVVDFLLQKNYPDKQPDENSHERLARLWQNDFKPVCMIRNENAPVPADYSDLKKYIEEVVARVAKPALIVNCENEEDTPDFEQPSGCWDILVGGSKLSRGYTIEGLTTSYFSRKPGQLDTLVQMARWYGFRPNFKDLVRLYIPDKLPDVKKNSKISSRKKSNNSAGYPLLAVFRFGAMVEEAFRQNLLTHSHDWKPSEIPPKVQYEFETFQENFRRIVKPTAQNKMRHTVYESSFIGGTVHTLTVTASNYDAMIKNQKILEKLLLSCSPKLEKITMRFDSRTSCVSTGIITKEHFLEYMENIQYYRDKSKRPSLIQHQLSALKQMTLSQWRVLLFWPKNVEWKIQLGSFEIPRWGRGYRYETEDGNISVNRPYDPKDLDVCRWLAMHDTGAKLNSTDTNTLQMRSNSIGVLYIIPFWHVDKQENDVWHFLWCAVYPGSGQAGSYRVVVNGK